MSLVSYLIPNLIQGVSQQPDGQRDPTQGEVQINAVSSQAEGLRKRDGTEAIAMVSSTPFGDVAFHQIERDRTERYLVVIGKSAVQVFDLDGLPRTVTAPSGYGYLSSVQAPSSDIRAATIADFTFISNTRAVPAMATPVAPATARPTAHECLVWVKAANYGQTYRVNINGTEAAVTTPVAAVVVQGSTTTENRISSETIAEAIRTALAGVAGVTITRSGSVLWVQSANPITVRATDARANADITAITSRVQAFTELPTISPLGYQVEIAGDPSNKFDNYYVAFRPRPGIGTFGEGTWEETVAPGLRYRIDAATMPHVLVRLANGQFYFGPANGSTQSGTAIPSWGERTAGDLDTAPDPSFIGNPIQDVFIFKNRLGILADENIVLSRSRDFFEFFPETVTGVLDTDPIDLRASNPKVSVLRYAIPSQDELIVTSDQIQFRFSSSDSLLSPATAQINLLTSYEIDPDVRPIVASGSIIMCQVNNQFSRFREFSVRGAGTALVADADEITAHVSTYIPNQVTRLAANDTGNAWFAISRKQGYKNRIYVYKYFFRNSGAGAERVQSSWSFWETCADQILQILCVQEQLYMLCQYGNEVWLERLSVTDRLGNAPPLLDRRVSTTTLTPASMRVASGAWDPVNRTTTWTLPYTIRATTQAWSGVAPGQNSMVMLGQAASGSTIVGRGDWRGRAVWFGVPYDFVYRFTRFRYYKEVGGIRTAVSAMRTQIRYALLRYQGTFFFKAWVKAERRDPAVYTFDGTALAVRGSTIGDEVDTSNVADVTPPAALTLALATDTGGSGADGVTSDPTINVSGVEPGATWEFSVNSGNTWAPGAGSSFVAPAGTYGSGALQARQTDSAGNRGPAGQNQTEIVVYDPFTIPSIPGVSLTVTGTRGRLSHVTRVRTRNSVSQYITGGECQFSYPNYSSSDWSGYTNLPSPPVRIRAETITGTCPPNNPGPRDVRIFVVLANGDEFGAFNLNAGFGGFIGISVECEFETTDPKAGPIP